jgi:hypothetical protein
MNQQVYTNAHERQVHFAGHSPHLNHYCTTVWCQATRTKFNWTSAEFYTVNDATYLNRRT